MFKIVLLRHGESVWNLANRFTGWTDKGLSEQGVRESYSAADSLKKEGFVFDVAYTSFLKRAIKTLWIVMEEMDIMWVPVYRSWRLNERHYGALQGLNKNEMAEKFGEEQVLVWRRSYDTPPPSLAKEDKRYPGNDSRYKDLKEDELPVAESLKDTVNRFMPYWHDVIAPDIRSGRRIIIVAHGNSLRALVKYLEGISDYNITGLNIPTGVPLMYELGKNLKPINKRYLGDEETAKNRDTVYN